MAVKSSSPFSHFILVSSDSFKCRHGGAFGDDVEEVSLALPVEAEAARA